MKRRHLINWATPVAGATLAACSRSQIPSTEATAPESVAGTVRWRMATSWPKSLDIIFGTAELFCQTLSQLTGGQFIITPYESGELAPGLKVLDAVSAGEADCGHTGSHYYLSKHPALAFSAGLSFGLTPQQHSAWLLYGGGLKAVREIYATLGVINFSGGHTSTQMGGWFKREINSVSDLKNLRMRIPGLGGEIMSRLGVEVKSLAADTIVQSLIADELDAVEWIGPYDDEQLGLDQVAPYYYYPGWWTPSGTTDFMVNLEQWTQLPTAYQEAFEAAASLANQMMLARYNAKNSQALQRMRSKGTETRPFSTEVLRAVYAIANELYAEIANENAEFKQIFDTWQQFRQQIHRWHSVNELSFVNFAYAN